MLCALLLIGVRPTQLTFVRHGETLANATGRYTARSIDTFSPLGVKQVAALTRELEAQPRFDRILVSPSPRALRSIAPYLAATHQRAVIWPLLYECCTGARKGKMGKGPLRFGPRISIPADLRAYFVLTPNEERLPVAPDYASGLTQVAAAANEFRERFSGGRVLLVGHSGMGGQFLHALTGKWIRVPNAKEITVALK